MNRKQIHAKEDMLWIHVSVSACYSLIAWHKFVLYIEKVYNKVALVALSFSQFCPATTSSFAEKRLQLPPLCLTTGSHISQVMQCLVFVTHIALSPVQGVQLGQIPD